MHMIEIGGTRILCLPAEGPLLGTSQDALDLLGETWGQDIAMIAIPVARLTPAFFDLRSGLAGEIFQKFQNYGVRLVVVGDFPAQAKASVALRDFIFETNTIGRHLFVVSMDALRERLDS